MIFIEGYLLGLGTLIFIGPVFFYLLQTTLEKGSKYGVIVALGIIVSDIACVAICASSAKTFFHHDNNQFWLAIVGSIILFFLGLKYIIKPSLNTNIGKPLSTNKLAIFTQGFLINFVNPFVFMVWIGFLVYGETKSNNSSDLLLFVVAILLGIFTTDLIKVFLANKIKSYLQPNSLIKIYRIIGILLIAFSVSLLFFTF